MNLSQNEMKVVMGLGALLGSLAELPDGWAPRSMLYVAMSCDVDISEAAIRLAERQGWVTTTSTVVRATESGLAKGRQINEILEGRA